VRSRYVWHNGAWRDVTNAPRRASRFPSIIRDGMDALQHPATGEVFDSKSAFRAATKAAGCVELGNDAPSVAPAPVYDTASIKADLATAYDQVEAGYVPTVGEDVGAGIIERVYE
jgi:hypothetical protein